PPGALAEPAQDLGEDRLDDVGRIDLRPEPTAQPPPHRQPQVGLVREEDALDRLEVAAVEALDPEIPGAGAPGGRSGAIRAGRSMGASARSPPRGAGASAGAGPAGGAPAAPVTRIPTARLGGASGDGSAPPGSALETCSASGVKGVAVWEKSRGSRSGEKSVG